MTYKRFNDRIRRFQKSDGNITGLYLMNLDELHMFKLMYDSYMYSDLDEYDYVMARHYDPMDQMKAFNSYFARINRERRTRR